MRRYQIAVVGAGPAALTCVQKLLELGTLPSDICVVYSNSSSRCISSPNGLRIKNTGRYPGLTGTAKLWDGLCGKIEAFNFTKREYLELDGWLSCGKELFEYTKKLSFVDASHLDDSTKSINGHLASTVLHAKLPVERFASIDIGAIDSFEGKVKLITFDKLSKRKTLHIVGLGFDLTCDKLLICCGALESIELIHNSYKEMGINTDLIGKYFMNHPRFYAGSIKLKEYDLEELQDYFGHVSKNLALVKVMHLTDSEILKSNITGAYARLFPRYNWTEKPAVVSFIQHIKKVRNFHKLFNRGLNIDSAAEVISDGKDSYGSFFTIVSDPLSILRYVYHKVFKSSEIAGIDVYIHLEMAPRKENSVKVENDYLEVNYFLDDIEQKSYMELKNKILKHFAPNLISDNLKSFNSIDEFRMEFNATWESDASHYMGGLVMGERPDSSVVDVNLELHSIPNAFVCSSAVFPTSGVVNPTATICALAVRLAKYVH